MLSTQKKQFSNEVILATSQVDNMALLALDLQKAFDTVEHTDILNGITSINPGRRVYDHVRVF